jgi:hypothetical protein
MKLSIFPRTRDLTRHGARSLVTQAIGTIIAVHDCARRGAEPVARLCSSECWAKRRLSRREAQRRQIEILDRMGQGEKRAFQVW